MNLGQPQEAVVPSLDGAVLLALARTSSDLSGREVARMVGSGSVAGVHRVLVRLSAQGIVRVDRRSHSVLYSANRDHVAWPAVEVLADLRHEVFRRLENHIGSWSSPPESAAVFGSFARREGDVDSDVDLLLVRPDDVDLEVWSAQVDGVTAAVERWTGNAASPYDISMSELRAHVRAEEPIVMSWRREAITLVGTDVPTLLRRVSS